jgi:hypothetical protein
VELWKLSGPNFLEGPFGPVELNQFHRIHFLEFELVGIESIRIQFISNFSVWLYIELVS